MTRAISLLIVDDDVDVSDAIAAAAGQHDDVNVVGALLSADRLLDTIAELRPDVVLIDLTMQGFPPLEAVRQAAQRFPATRALAFSGYDDRVTIDHAFDAGAWGFVSKHAEMREIFDGVRRVSRGEIMGGRGQPR
jgi:DNA-binding NarL/FixJ family response regulator